MNKTKLVGVCSTCLLLKGISALSAFRFSEEIPMATLGLATAVVASYAVFREKKWGYLLASVVMGIHLALNLSTEVFYQLAGDAERILLFLAPEQTATIIIGFVSALLLMKKKQRPNQSEISTPLRAPRSTT